MWGRESLTANDNDWIRVSLKIIRAPSAGRGRRAKRGGVGFRESGSTVTRGQPPPLFLPPSKGRREKEGRICAANESTLSTADAVPLPHAGNAIKLR